MCVASLNSIFLLCMHRPFIKSYSVKGMYKNDQSTYFYVYV